MIANNECFVYMFQIPIILLDSNIKFCCLVLLKMVINLQYMLSNPSISASGKAGEKILLYRGCFKLSLRSDKRMNEPLLSSCQEKCSAGGFVFLAVEVFSYFQ